MEQIKPGTRCECGDEACAKALGRGHHWSPKDMGYETRRIICERNAVRMVTVRDDGLIDKARREYNEVSNYSMRNHSFETKQEKEASRAVYLAEQGSAAPMCEACASFHESKVTR